MNDLNEKLWSDAVESYIDSTANDDIDLTDPYVVREIRKKFAELIVEEMYDFIMEESAKDNGIPDLGKVKEHFGVEEK